MQGLTARQQEILDYIQSSQYEHGLVPTLREIAHQFGFRSMTAAADHVRALRRKGYLEHQPRRARSHSVISPLQPLRHPLVDIPLYGSIPAGFAQDRQQEADGCISADVESLGISPRARVFALRVLGDSMIGRQIVDGDIAIIERGPTPRPGDVVAALIDGASTLKTLVLNRGVPCLRAENPRYPDLVPAHQLVIQGVVVALIRQFR